MARGFRFRAACWSCAALLAGFIGSTHAADYRFTPEPSYPPERLREIYQPLVAYLSRSTGENFVLVAPKNYHAYWRSLHDGGETEFAYDEAHLVDYRVKRLNFVPLVRNSGQTRYALLALDEFDSKNPSAIFGRRIMTMPAPSLGYAVLAEFYTDPVNQPTIISSAVDWRDAVQSVFGGDADAAIVPASVRDTYPNLVTLRTSREFPGPAVTAAPGVPAELQQKVRDALLRLGEDAALGEMLLELGIDKFVPASADEYDGNRDLLKGFFGYD